jgi:uncharacterized integral membrane protein
MSKHTIIALILMVFFIVVLLLVKGKVDIPILAWRLDDVPTNFALLGSMITGTVIGALLK